MQIQLEIADRVEDSPPYKALGPGLRHSANVVCVYGALRSGTTMLRLMLDSHPQLSCPGESDVIFGYLQKQGRGWTLDREALQRDWLFKTSGLRLGDGAAEAEVAAMVRQTGRGRDWTVLMLHRGLDRALEFLPEMRVIHMLRDPRDVARSSIEMGWAGNVFHGVDHWVETEDGWTGAARRIDAERVLEVHYEDLVRQPEAEIARICAFLGVAYDPAMLTYDERTTYAKPDRALVSKWRKDMRPRDLALLEGRLGSRLESRGYTPSGRPPLTPTRVRRLGLAFGNKLRIWGRQFHDHGVIDPIAVLVARRLHAPGLAKRARERMDERIIASVK